MMFQLIERIFHVYRRWKEKRAGKATSSGKEPSQRCVQTLAPQGMEITPRNEKIIDSPRTIDPAIKERREQNRKLTRIRENIASDVNDVLDIFSEFRWSTIDEKYAGADASRALAKFDGAELLLMADYLDEMPGGSEWRTFDPTGEEDQFAQAIWPIDLGFITRNEEYWTISRTYTMEPKDVRGKARIVPSKIVNNVQLTRWNDGKWRVEELPAGLIGKAWTALDYGMERSHVKTIDVNSVNTGRVENREIKAQIRRSIAMMFSLALTERYSWHALFGFGNGPRIMIPTSPRGCLALFKNREKGDSSNRREALRHWVHHHYRISCNDDVGYVRDHLRGATEFKWYGLDCELRVSEYDIEKNDLFKQEAEKWRKTRKHNRVRVKLKGRRDQP